MNICCLKANRHYNLQFCSENKLLLLLHTLNVTSGFGAEKKLRISVTLLVYITYTLWNNSWKYNNQVLWNKLMEVLIIRRGLSLVGWRGRCMSKKLLLQELDWFVFVDHWYPNPLGLLFLQSIIRFSHFENHVKCQNMMQFW